MDDSVRKVLAERAALDTGVGAGIAISLLLHGAVTAVAIYGALHQAAPETLSTINIRFAPVSRAAATASRRPLPPAPVAPPAKTAPVPKTTASIEGAKPAAVTPVPVAKTVPLSPFGKSSKRGSDVVVPHTSPPLPTPSTATRPIDIPVGGSGVTGLEGGDFPYTLYIDRMKTLIGSHWFRPAVPGGATTVYFIIERDGAIHDVKTEAASGNGSFDRAALRAVLETSPLPPLPFAYSGTYLGVHLTFR